MKLETQFRIVLVLVVLSCVLQVISAILKIYIIAKGGAA